MASKAPDWRWGAPLPPDSLELASYNVMAVFPSLEAAEESVAGLRSIGLPDDRVSLTTRTMSDDPSARRVEPGIEAPTRRRDAEVAGRVFTKAIGLSVAVALSGALVGFLIALVAGAGSTTIVIAAVVGAVTGAVVGGVWGGAAGSMTEAQRESGVVVGVHVADPEAARRAEALLRARGPLRLDRYDGQGRPVENF